LEFQKQQILIFLYSFDGWEMALVNNGQATSILKYKSKRSAVYEYNKRQKDQQLIPTVWMCSGGKIQRDVVKLVFRLLNKRTSSLLLTYKQTCH